MNYHAITPPPGATCGHHACATLALVRAVPAPGQGGPLLVHDAWDSCDLHWPVFRDHAARQGHQITDATGDPHQLPREFPPWRVFRSDLGRWYATRPGTTVYGWLTGQLRAEIEKCHASTGPRVPGGAA
jgi:hypothetical protein